MKDILKVTVEWQDGHMEVYETLSVESEIVQWTLRCPGDVTYLVPMRKVRHVKIEKCSH